jgi:hypothetical protein
MSGWWQQGAGPDCAGAWYPNGQDPPAPMAGPLVAEQVVPAGHLWTAHVGYPAGGLAQSDLDEPGRHLVWVDRLEPGSLRALAPQAASPASVPL